MTNILIIVLLVTISNVNAQFSGEENALLPVLFHLDDHDRCLLQPGGLYCLGEFDLTPVGTSRTYENIQKYASNNPDGFNRSRLHRGYCVSTRCPSTEKNASLLFELSTRCPSTEKNASLLFEQCVDARMRRYALSAHLRKLQYCNTQQQQASKAQQPPDAAQQLFLRIVYALLVLNIVGTVYDIATGDKETKNGLITAWSVRASWRRLTATYDDGDPRLTQLEVIHGIRTVVMVAAIYVHCIIQHYQFYVINPNFLELLYQRPDGILLSNGTSFIQLFVILSSFLTVYNLLIYGEKHKLNLSNLPVIVVHRIIRIAPVHLLVVGFAATYFPTMNFAAVSYIAEESSASCRRKFWAHVLFLNNIVEKQDQNCVSTSWYLAADMHLFILTSALTIVMYRRKQHALRLYAALCIFSALACGLVSYIMEYQSFIYEIVPEKIREYNRHSESLGGYYVSTWGSLPACFLGMLLAHLHYDLQQKKYDWNQNEWFKQLLPWIQPIMIIVILCMGVFFRQYNQPWVKALYLTVDRPVIISVLSFALIGYINVDGVQRKFFAWRGWRVPARLSLPMMLCHWLVSVAVAARPVAYHTSVFDVSIDYLATIFYGYLVSMLVALLVEIPVQRFFAQLL